jgi:hypothetical protein
MVFGNDGQTRHGLQIRASIAAEHPRERGIGFVIHLHAWGFIFMEGTV